MAEVEETDHGPLDRTGLLDKEEFDEAFRVFSENELEMSTANSVLLPFLRSLGVRVESNHTLVYDIKKPTDSSHRNMIKKSPLRDIINRHIRSFKEPWPAHEDALKAFQVFDTEGVGFIKVTLLKRFLVQAQLDVEDSVLERLIQDNCHIDGDDLINYEEFIHNIAQKSGSQGYGDD